MKEHTALLAVAMLVQIAWLSTVTLIACWDKWDGRSLFVVIRFIALISSVEISLFVMSIPCVVSTLPSASWFIIFAFTFTGMVLWTLPFAINIVLTILLAIAFLITGSNFIIELLPCIEFVAWMVIAVLLWLEYLNQKFVYEKPLSFW